MNFIDPLGQNETFSFPGPTVVRVLDSSGNFGFAGIVEGNITFRQRGSYGSYDVTAILTAMPKQCRLTVPALSSALEQKVLLGDFSGAVFISNDKGKRKFGRLVSGSIKPGSKFNTCHCRASGSSSAEDLRGVGRRHSAFPYGDELNGKVSKVVVRGMAGASLPGRTAIAPATSASTIRRQRTGPRSGSRSRRSRIRGGECRSPGVAERNSG